MSNNIILKTDDIVVCPECEHKFPIELGITRQTISKYEQEYEQIFQERSETLEKQLTEENEKRIKKIKEDAETKLKKEFDQERKELQDTLNEQGTKLKESRAKELKLLKEQKKLEEDKEIFELQKETELREAKKGIAEKAAQDEYDKFKLREADYRKQLEDAKKSNEDLTRKLERASQQAQGEVLEQEVESVLVEAFRYDDIKEIAKGARGADVLQCVRTQSGQVCGNIIWEAKRAQNWSPGWLKKVKEDCILHEADIPVIVSTNPPKDCAGLFTIIDGVWVCSDKIIRPLAEVLREMLIQASDLKNRNEDSGRKADLLYSYLGSRQFEQNLISVFQTFVDMENDLNREKRAMYKNLKKRQLHLESVWTNMINMATQINAVSKGELFQLESIPQLQLPGEAVEQDAD